MEVSTLPLNLPDLLNSVSCTLLGLVGDHLLFFGMGEPNNPNQTTTVRNFAQ